MYGHLINANSFRSISSKSTNLWLCFFVEIIMFIIFYFPLYTLLQTKCFFLQTKTFIICYFPLCTILTRKSWAIMKSWGQSFQGPLFMPPRLKISLRRWPQSRTCCLWLRTKSGTRGYLASRQTRERRQNIALLWRCWLIVFAQVIWDGYT